MPSDTQQVSDFREIVERYQHRIVSIAYRMLGDLEESRDMAQEAFFRYWQRGMKSIEKKAIFSFLSRTVTNLCIDQLRKRKKFRLFSFGSMSPETEPPASDDPECEVIGRELVHLVLKAAERLKPKQKAVFVLRDIEGYSVKEAADILGCTENNVLVTLHQARKHLKKWLGPKLR